MSQKRISIRIENELLSKLHIVADNEKRSVNNQVLFIIRNHIKQHEEKHGIIRGK